MDGWIAMYIHKYVHTYLHTYIRWVEGEAHRERRKQKARRQQKHKATEAGNMQKPRVGGKGG